MMQKSLRDVPPPENARCVENAAVLDGSDVMTLKDPEILFQCEDARDAAHRQSRVRIIFAIARREAASRDHAQ